MSDSSASQPASPPPSAADSPAVVAVSEPRRDPKPWGFWWTLLFTVGFVIVYAVLQTVLLVGLVLVEDSRDPARAQTSMPTIQRFEETAASGTFVGLFTTAAGVLIPIGCVLVAWLRKGITVSDYLAFRIVSAKMFFSWLGIGVAFAVGFDLLTWAVNQDVMSNFMTNARTTAAWLPMFWIGVVLGAPLSEEFFFRGFLLAGFKNSVLGTHGSVIVIAAIFAGLHLQYELFGVLTVFGLGLLLGYARVYSNSLWVPIAMHALHNFIATVELELYLRSLPQ